MRAAPPCKDPALTPTATEQRSSSGSNSNESYTFHRLRVTDKQGEAPRGRLPPPEPNTQPHAQHPTTTTQHLVPCSLHGLNRTESGQHTYMQLSNFSQSQPDIASLHPAPCFRMCVAHRDHTEPSPLTLGYPILLRSSMYLRKIFSSCAQIQILDRNKMGDHKVH